MLDSNKIKRIDINEFRTLGYLQEVNRQFLHPLGLALEVIVGFNGTAMLGGVWDYRDDPSGIVYGISDEKDDVRIKAMKEKALYINQQLLDRSADRQSNCGFIIEPIPGVGGNETVYPDREGGQLH